jgi:hypothetical protein
MYVVSLCMCHMLWPWHSPQFDTLIRSGEEYKSCSFLLYSFLYCCITFPLLRLKYLPEDHILEHLCLYKKRKIDDVGCMCTKVYISTCF